MAETIIVLQIVQFHNCHGCKDKLKATLRKLGGIKLVSINPERGNVTISSAKHPEEIIFALKRKLKKQVLLLSQEISPPNQIPSIRNSHTSLIRQNPNSSQGTFNVPDVTEALLRISEARGSDSVELVHSETWRLNFRNRENQPEFRSSTESRVGFPPPPPPPPWSTAEPTAPLIPAVEEEVYGYPLDFYRSSRDDDPSGCCPIL